jgi:predicted amidohydrolase YtcJ
MSTTLYRNGRLHAASHPGATSLVDVDGVIGWVGRSDDATRHLESVDRVVDLEGRFVTPAFVDAHVHTTSAGLALTGLDLSRATTLGEALDLVAQSARARRGAVVLGHGWDESTWPERRPPTRAELDRASYGGVVYLSRIDVHSCVVSSALLAAVPESAAYAGFDPDGWLRQEAHHPVRAAAFVAVTPSQAAAARRAIREHAAALGIGSFHELGGPDINGADDFAAVLQQSAREPGPTVIGYWGALGDDGIAQATAMGARGAAGDLFVDGAIGSRTAHLCEPYADADTRGAQYLSTEQIRDHVVSCTRAGIQAGFHVIGDAATQSVLQGLREAATIVGVPAIRQRRHRVEHIEMPGEGIEVLADLGVHASVQPLFDAMWGGPSAMYADRLGIERAAQLNPFGVMQRAGVPLALGSDAPVTAMGPWAAIQACVNHHVPQFRLSAADAFVAHTQGGWRATGDDVAGVISVGAPTTLATWDCPDFPDTSVGAAPPTCLRTIVEGQTVYSTQTSIHEDVST